MTEKELMWAHLRNDWTVMSHVMGQELVEHSSGKDFLKKADDYLNKVLDLADPVSATRVVATWLKTYNLPLEPDKMKSFRRFHNLCHSIAVNRTYGGEYPRPN